MTDFPPIPDLPAELQRLLRQIPRGRVTTYGDLAEALGDLTAARWVGEYLLDHPHDENCVCHRVIRRTGELGLHISRDEQEKARRLVAEGVVVRDNRVDLSEFGVASFDSTQPLLKLKQRQEQLLDRFIAEALQEIPELVGGVDLSYADDDAIAAFALVETGTGNLLYSQTHRLPQAFPYISGYLAFRELPVLLELIDLVAGEIDLPEVTFVDGNGILHPRRAGIATHLGITAGLRTVGVGKKLLCGSVDLDALTEDNSQPVIFQDQLIGAAVKAGQRSRPIFVSPGHRMTVEDSVALTRALFHGHRLPEPLYHADRLSRAAAKAK